MKQMRFGSPLLHFLNICRLKLTSDCSGNCFCQKPQFEFWVSNWPSKWRYWNGIWSSTHRTREKVAWTTGSKGARTGRSGRARSCSGMYHTQSSWKRNRGFLVERHCATYFAACSRAFTIWFLTKFRNFLRIKYCKQKVLSEIEIKPLCMSNYTWVFDEELHYLSGFLAYGL